MLNESLDIESLFSMKGKIALVTGGSRGVGRMITQALLQAGADRVYITARKAAACEQAADELSQFGDCVAIPADVADSASRKVLVAGLQALESKLHVLVNNAGTAWGSSYEDFPEEAFDKVMDINVKAMFALTRDLTPMLERTATLQDPARVINIGSIEGLHISSVHRTGNYAYTSSKAAVHHLTRHLAVHLGPRNIAVNAIAPGFFPTKGTSLIFDKFNDDAVSNSPIRRLGEVEDMAGIAIYLSSRAGAYTSGAVIPVDGGTCINHQHVRD